MNDSLISCDLDVSGFKDHFVVGLNLREMFSDTFKANIIVAVSDQAVSSLQSFISKACTFTLHGIQEEKKTVHGVITAIYFRDTAGDRTLVELLVEPALVKASFGRQRKVFQNKSVLDIAEEVLGQSGHSLNKSKLSRTPVKREYCVQYDETDLAFIERLMMSEGIGYFFAHSASKSELVLADSKTAYVGENNALSGPALGLNHYGVAGRSDEVSFSSLELEHTLALREVCVRAYDPENATLLTEKQTTAKEGVGQWFHFDARPLDSDGAMRLSEHLSGSQKTASETIRLTTDSILLSPGVRFRTAGHPRSEDVGDLVVLESQCVIENDTFRYEVVAQSIDAPIRVPEGDSVSKSAHLDIAVVVGPENEEVWTDKHGRVLVQFKWDRFGTQDETSSCWLRVSQIWAGRGFGGQFIPRIGQEVLVDFLGGDIDQPVVVGCLYNSEQDPPFALPANQDQSGIRTQSFEGQPEDAHWLIFSDKAKNEFVNLHSNKDLLVESLDQTVHVSGTSHRLAVNLGEDQDQLGELGEDVSELFVNGSRKETISNNLETTVGGSYPWASGENQGSYLLKVDGDFKTEVGGDMITDVSGDFKLNVAGSLIIAVDGTIEISAESDLDIESKAGITETGATVSVTAKTGALSVKASSGAISLQGGTSATLQGGTSATVKGGGSVTIQGATTSVQGSGGLALKGATVAISQG